MDRRLFIKSGVLATAGVGAAGVEAIASKSINEQINDCMEQLIDLCQQSAPEGYTVDQINWAGKLQSGVMVLAANGSQDIKSQPKISGEWKAF